VHADGKDQRVVVMVTAKEHDALEAALDRTGQGGSITPLADTSNQRDEISVS
jgi:hypothetical protein